MGSHTWQPCPLTTALDMIGGKWHLIVLYALAKQPRRFNELQRLTPGISHKVLTRLCATSRVMDWWSVLPSPGPRRVSSTPSPTGVTRSNQSSLPWSTGGHACLADKSSDISRPRVTRPETSSHCR